MITTTIRTLLIAVILLAGDVLGAPASPWIMVSNMATARDQFAGCVIGDKIYVFGGNNNPGGINLKSGEVYDIGSVSWSSIASNNNIGTVNEIEEVTGVAVNGKFYVFGKLSTGPSFDQVYDPALNTWTTLQPNPEGTSVTTPAVYDGKIYLFGGHVIGGTGYSDAVMVYDPVHDTWDVATHMPKIAQGCAVAVYNDSAYVIGGGDVTAKKWNMEVMVYDFVSNTWTRNYCTIPSIAYFYCANSTSTQTPVVDGKAYLVGGIEGTVASNWPTKKFTIFDINSCQWQTGASLPEARAGNLTVTYNNELYVIGGYAGPGNSNDLRPSKSTVYYLSNVKPILQFGNLVGTKNTKLTVNDSYGVPVTFILTGGGYGEVSEDAGQITLYGTTEKSLLTISTPKGKTATISSIKTSGSLKGIMAKTVNLNGDIEIAGSAGTLTFKDATGSIFIGSSSNPKAAVTMAFNQVSDLDIESDMPIKSIKATEWIDGGTINAPSIGSITTKGDKKRDICGDLDVDVNVDGTVGTVKVACQLSGSWECNAINSITTLGADDAILTLNRAPDPAGKILALGKLTIKEYFDYSRIISSGHIGTITAGEFWNSTCFAGVAPSAINDNLYSDNVLDLPVADSTTFNQTATIKSIKINGIKGETYGMINSNIAAANILSVSIVNPYFYGGQSFGIAADSIKSLKVKSPTWSCLKTLNVPGDVPTNLPGDFKINIK